MVTQREHFGSRLGFILAASASAVGIGNLVGFPVAATKNGGGAFLLIYMCMVAFICLPVMLAEFTLGRYAQKDPYGSYKTVSGNSPWWKAVGSLPLLTPFMIAVFYSVVTVWLLGYFIHAVTGQLDKLADTSYFGVFITSTQVFVYLAVVMFIVFLTLAGGVQNGIERVSKVLMQVLFFMMIGLIVFVLTQDNAFKGLRYYLVPDLSKIDAKVISGAMSQAFFSLSLGMGILITYGSYMGNKTNLPQSAKLVALADTSVAFLAGLLILPAIFSFNPDTDTDTLSESSVSLVFTFLPKIFLAMQTSIGFIGASFFASIFFLLVFFAAITSLISIMEVPLCGIMEQRAWPRRKALVLLIVFATVCAVVCALSFGQVGFLTEFISYAGVNKSLFDIVIDVFYDTILPLNGFFICLFVSYRWKKANFKRALAEGTEGYEASLFQRYVDLSLGTIIPAILFVIFINTVALKFFGYNLMGF